MPYTSRMTTTAMTQPSAPAACTHDSGTQPIHAVPAPDKPAADTPTHPATDGACRLLVMGLAAGYHYGDVRPFVASLRETGFAGDCTLFVSPTTRDLDRIAAHDVDCRTIDRQTDYEALSHLPWNALRFFIYRDHLRRLPSLPDAVLLCDVRDIIFQSDPAARLWGTGLCCTLEDRRMTVGDCPYMRRWMCGHLGEPAWNAIAHHNISCSGTVAGGASAVLCYLDAMCDALLPFVPGPGMAGYDQGVHNHLLRNGALGIARLTDNSSGPILTLGYKTTMPERDNDGRILCDDGTPAVIVHQYDRMPGLFADVRARYAPPRRPRETRRPRKTDRQRRSAHGDTSA